MGAKRTFSQGVELPSLDIRFELPVPDRSVEIRKPLAEPGELFWRELLDLPFDDFYRAHGYDSTILSWYHASHTNNRISGPSAVAWIIRSNFKPGFSSSLIEL